MARHSYKMKEERVRAPMLARAPTKRTSELSAERLRQLLRYSPQTGRFYWRVSRGGTVTGMEAGSRTRSHAYRVISIDGVSHMAHRLAWLYVYGRHPGEIDHINRKPTDNRIANLQESSRPENAWNRTIRSRSGVKGVRFRGPTWEVRITRDGEQINLGSYPTRAEAKAAFQGAAIARQFLFDMKHRGGVRTNRKLIGIPPAPPNGSGRRRRPANRPSPQAS